MRGEEKFGGMYDGGEDTQVIPNVGEAEPVTPVGDGEGDFSVPQEYQEKGWAKDLTSYGDVYKKLDGAETLIGQKQEEGGVQLPKEDATPEDLASFYGSMGRPKEAGEYTFNREGQSEAMTELNTDEMDNAVKDIFHRHGLRPEQATGVQIEYEALLSGMLEEQVNAKKALDDGFEDMTTKAFGNEKETVIANAKTLIEQNTPEGFGDYVKGLPNEALTVMAGVINQIKSKYISEDTFNNLKNGGGGGGNSKEELRKQGQELMLTKEFTDEFSPYHQKRKDEVTAIYEQIAKLNQ